MYGFGKQAERIARQLGCDLVPCDVRFLECCGSTIRADRADATAEKYAEHWIGAMAPVEGAGKQNAGRQAANSWLRRALVARGLPVPTVDDMRRVKV